jgi:Cu/Ag efflux protein CusF
MVGEHLVMELDEGNQIIDVDRVAEGEIGEMGKFHKTVAGEVVKIDPAKKRVTLKLKDGASRTYRMKDAAATKMGGVKAGTAVVMEIDEENHLVNDFDVKR